MPLVAINKNTNERICICDHNEPRLTIPKDGLVCPNCGEELIIVTSSTRINHFRHKALCGNTAYASHPESAEHLFSKSKIREFLISHYKESAGVKVDLEVRMPEVMRIADIMVTFPLGWRKAYEIQLAAITPNNLKQRTDDYRAAGVDVHWFIGRNALTQSNVEACKSISCESTPVDIAWDDEL